MALKRDKFGLTESQCRFVDAYIQTGKVEKAAIMAGYSKAGAAASGSRLLKDPRVQQKLAAFRAETAEKLQLSQEWVLQETMLIAGNTMAKDADRLKALELLGKHLGTWEPRTDKGDESVRKARFEALLAVGRQILDCDGSAETPVPEVRD
jgi:phage terminase small subunit